MRTFDCVYYENSEVASVMYLHEFVLADLT